MNKIKSLTRIAPAVRAGLSAYGRLFRKPLKLYIADRELYFRRLQDFDFCVAPRIAVPALRFNELFRRPLAELQSEASNMRTLERQMRGILEDFQEHGISCTGTLRHLGVGMISKDHEWRAIFIELVETQSTDDAYTEVALTRYLQYLAARQDVIRMLIGLKRDAGSEAVRRDAFAPEKSTVIVECNARPAMPHEHELKRLPQGEAVTLRLENGKEMTIKLAKHRFSLFHGQQWSLMTDDGRRYVLREGVNSVGRSRDNDVAVDACMANVSRKHLLAQPVGADTIVLTDLSSYGTYIPPAAIAS